MPRKENKKTEGPTDFGRYLSALCKLLGTNPYQVSQMAKARHIEGLSQSTLWSWANDGNRPESIEKLEKLFTIMRTFRGWKGEVWEHDLIILADHVIPQRYKQALDTLATLEQEVENRRTHPNVHDEL